jgi:putative membrane protein
MAGRSPMSEFPVLNALVFTVLGVLVFVVAFAIVVKLAPLNLWKEIVQERNVAAAILAGAVALGLCWIIAAAMH